MKTLLLILLLPVLASAQVTRTGAFRGASQMRVAAGGGGSWGSPTNNTDGTIPLVWYVADDYTTNTTPILPDRWTNQWNLENKTAAAGGSWPEWGSGDVLGSGHKYISAPSSGNLKFLTNNSYTVVQPTELVFVIAKTNLTLSWVYGGKAAATEQAGLVYPAGNWDINAGGTDNQAGVLTSNKWMVMSFVHSNTITRFYTNLTVGANVNGGVNGASGFTLFNGYARSAGPAGVSFGELLVYSSVLSATARSNLYVYLTNKYSLSP